MRNTSADVLKKLEEKDRCCTWKQCPAWEAKYARAAFEGRMPAWKVMGPGET